MCDIMQPAKTKFVVPQAAKLPISCLEHEAEQHCWFDLLKEDLSAKEEEGEEWMDEDETGLNEVRCGRREY